MTETNETNKKKNAQPQLVAGQNAWVIKIGNKASLDRFSITANLVSSNCRGVNEGDFFMVADERSEDLRIIALARLYRKRTKDDKTTFFFDGFAAIDPGKKISELDISPFASPATLFRMEWTVFEKATKAACGFPYSELPVLKGTTVHEQAYVRDLLQYAVMDDLLGPANGPHEEIVGMSVRDRYLVGKLAPLNTRTEEPDEEEELPGGSGRIDPEENGREANASTNQSLVPSSFGFTFCVDSSVEKLELSATWGRYERTESEEKFNPETENPLRAWKRIPSGGAITVSLTNRLIKPVSPDEECPEIVLQGSVSDPLKNGDRLVTVFLINNQTTPEQNQDEAWIFQPEIVAKDSERRPIFRRRPLFDSYGMDEERQALEMIYRHRVEFAVGHGVSVRAIPAPDDIERAVEVRTSVLPDYEIAITEPPGQNPADRASMRQMLDDGFLDMHRLADLDKETLISGLSILAKDYDAWISEQRNRIGNDVKNYDVAASDALERCERALKRLRDGIRVLETNDKALEAFQFANRAMAAQRIHSVYALLKRRGENPDIVTLDIPKNRSWRPFQLAFMLLSIPAMTDPSHDDRTQPIDAFADLLWFPTGGGKTEAYLGVAAFTMAIRRLQGNLGGLDASRGLSVIMRYTLRLLTIQQFQRATALICAMETIRRGEIEKWGNEPFTIGLWVGQRVTPNTTAESHEAIEKERDGKYGTGSTPAQLTACPWCGSEIVPGRDIRVEKSIGRTFIYCGDKLGNCEFTRTKSKDLGLPVLVVDDEIYRRPPSMLIATVDKFAMMAWRGQIRTLFGRADRECSRHGLLWPEADCSGNHQKKGDLPSVTVRQISQIRPPDLIIQDEFHLISGPLGTMVGLYETAVDALSTWELNGKAIRPKIVASTATVRKAEQQTNNVFLRRVAVFPPHGLDIDDNFFSVQRSIDEKPGRRYLGICAPGSSRPAVLIRVYVALLTAAQALFEKFEQTADPYMTLVGYFNSLRELGGMRRLSEDDVQTRAYKVLMSDVARPGLSQRSARNVDELTSRVSSKDIPKKLDQLEVKFKREWAKGETRGTDILLATNMLSVGVDVNRLGLMVVNGQPKNTAEYIQATSRVGRSFPGLVCTVLTWSRPRDLSHYETFEHYHATFYKHVEAQSVTPFAPRALDRGLTGVMVSLLRLDNEKFNHNLGAQQLVSSTDHDACEIKRKIADRAWKTENNKAAGQYAENMAAERIDSWVKESGRSGRRLGYETEQSQGDVAPLLKKSGVQAWDKLTVPMSMREVEPGVKLVMDIAKLSDPPPWKIKTRKTENQGGDR